MPIGSLFGPFPMQATGQERPGESADEPALATWVTTLSCEDLLALGRQADLFPQAAWWDSETGIAWIGIGAARERIAQPPVPPWTLIDDCRRELLRIPAPQQASKVLRYAGGVPFDPVAGAHPEWPAGGATRFFLPRLCLQQAPGSRQAILAVTVEADPARPESCLLYTSP
ncbi:MAG: hypothetical protein QUU85_10915, partial [Candidatus Eisenbacteria bacterium]|nr:hypothetical protein [Candidatus Eisenbacteria bacterium]